MVTILANLTMLRIAGEQHSVVPDQQSVEFNQRLRAVGVPSEMILIPGVNQSFIGKTPEQAVAATVREGGKVLVVERMIFADAVQSIPTLLSDINMLVLTGGLERTREEYARLFDGADLRLNSCRSSVVSLRHI